MQERLLLLRYMNPPPQRTLTAAVDLTKRIRRVTSVASLTRTVVIMKLNEIETSFRHVRCYEERDAVWFNIELDCGCTVQSLRQCVSFNGWAKGIIKSVEPMIMYHKYNMVCNSEKEN